MAIRVFTDVTSDLPAKYARERGLTLLPMTVTLDTIEYQYQAEHARDGLDIHAYYDALRTGSSSTTAQVNVQVYLDVFTQAIEAGDEVVYVAFSSGLSGSYDAACLARQQIEEKYPGKLFVVDSLAASLGQGLLVHLVLDKRDQGASAAELAQYAEEMRLRVNHWFTVDDLMFLKRGGRVSGAAAVMGSLLSIKPVLYVDDQGHLIPVTKVQGRKRALKALSDKMQALAPGAKEYPIFISHGDCEPDARLVEAAVKRELGVGATMLSFIGPVIGAHSGPGTVALFFVSEGQGRKI